VESRNILMNGEIEDQLGRLGTYRSEVLANTRKRRRGQCSRLGVVEADDRLIPGSTSPALLRAFMTPIAL